MVPNYSVLKGERWIIKQHCSENESAFHLKIFHFGFDRIEIEMRVILQCRAANAVPII